MLIIGINQPLNLFAMINQKDKKGKHTVFLLYLVLSNIVMVNCCIKCTGLVLTKLQMEHYLDKSPFCNNHFIKNMLKFFTFFSNTPNLMYHRSCIILIRQSCITFFTKRQFLVPNKSLEVSSYESNMLLSSSVYFETFHYIHTH